MTIDIKKENLLVNRLIENKKETINIEGDIIIPDIKPDILNTINTNGTVYISNKEIMDGQVKFDGIVNVNIIYLADDDSSNIRAVNTNFSFSQIMDMKKCKSNMNLDENIFIKTLDSKVLNGRKLTIKISLELNTKLYSNENIELINKLPNMPDIQILNKQFLMNSFIGEGHTKVYAKDTIIIDNIDNLIEILNTDINIINMDKKISYNKILGKADVELKIMYLTEDNRIKIIEAQIPVMGFIDIIDVKEDHICDINYKIKNILIKPNNIEEHSIYVEIEIEIYCRVYENKLVDIIQDLYCPTKKIDFSRKDIDIVLKKENIKSIHNIRENYEFEDMLNNKIYDVKVNSIINTQNILQDKVAYSGSTNLKFIYASDGTIGLNTKMVNIPFEFEIAKSQTDTNINFETTINTKNKEFIVMPQGDIEVRIDLEFNLDIHKLKQISIIDEVNIEELAELNNYSMIIYFVKPNDTLWNIAKRFNTTVDDILKINEIKDKDNINIGEQLFIPRYIKQVANM